MLPLARFITVVSCLVLSGCSAGSGKYYENDGPPGLGGELKAKMSDDVSIRVEEPHKWANRTYEVMGQKFKPMTTDKPFTQTGVASWYGKKFHGKKTAIGETYDMYAMTAAHPTMLLPSYAKVTNLENGRSVIVRVNDRGPFINSRVIDLSYAAAVKLGYREKGTAKVKIERITMSDIAKGKIPKTNASGYDLAEGALSDRHDAVKTALAGLGGLLASAAGKSHDQKITIDAGRIVESVIEHGVPAATAGDAIFSVMLDPIPADAPAESVPSIEDLARGADRMEELVRMVQEARAPEGDIPASQRIEAISGVITETVKIAEKISDAGKNTPSAVEKTETAVKPAEKPASPAIESASGTPIGWTTQIGMFAVESNAVKAAENARAVLSEKGLDVPVIIMQDTVNGKNLRRVLVGRAADRSDAAALAEQITKALGQKAYPVRK